MVVLGHFHSVTLGGAFGLRTQQALLTLFISMEHLRRYLPI
jgi:hypothetical protein